MGKKFEGFFPIKLCQKVFKQIISQVIAEAEVLRDLIQSAFVPRLIGVFKVLFTLKCLAITNGCELQGPLNNILVTEFLAGGDLVTRTANDDYDLTERKCQIFIRQVSS